MLAEQIRAALMTDKGGDESTGLRRSSGKWLGRKTVADIIQWQLINHPGIRLTDHIERQAAWSDKTFGIKGPVGALKHLAKEVEECLAKPDDIEEYADCLILVLDATRRAGFPFYQLMDAVEKKQRKNETRTWTVVEGDEPSFHV